MGEKPYHDDELLWALYWGQGWPIRKIAKKFDLDHTTIRNWMARNGIPRRDGGVAGGKARRREWVGHRLDMRGYEVWQDDIAEEHVAVHQILAIVAGADPHDVFADGTVCHHRSGHPLDNRPENLEVMTQSEHGSYHAQQEIPECKHRVLQSATIMSEARA